MLNPGVEFFNEWIRLEKLYVSLQASFETNQLVFSYKVQEYWIFQAVLSLSRLSLLEHFVSSKKGPYGRMHLAGIYWSFYDSNHEWTAHALLQKLPVSRRQGRWQAASECTGILPGMDYTTLSFRPLLKAKFSKMFNRNNNNSTNSISWDEIGFCVLISVEIKQSIIVGLEFYN